ncbi:MAG TPA: 5-formyltetrahydrofolate cyclo-ligase [Casimicrobiaceae bacterium]|jgi:5-formyltetrahydrofolate cyclo-ligase
MSSPTAPDDAPPPIGTALRDAKRAIRERVLAARDALTPRHRDAASRSIADRLAALPSFLSAHTVFVTIPFRNEWDSRLLAESALALGKTLASPRVELHTRMLSLHRVCDLAIDLAPGYRGIPEPTSQCAPVPIDAIEWVLVPGVAFDVHGRRLGYGGGYYDRLLPLLPRAAPRIAGAFEAQLVAEVPAAPHDLSVDFVITEARVIECASRAR